MASQSQKNTFVELKADLMIDLYILIKSNENLHVYVSCKKSIFL